MNAAYITLGCITLALLACCYPAFEFEPCNEEQQS